MKKLYILLFISAALAIQGCKKTFLDRVPQDQAATETFWNTEKDARLALNGCYGMLDGMAYDAWYYDGFTDNAYDQYSWESAATVAAAGDILPTTDFGYSYTYIRRTNNFMDNIEKVQMDATLKKRYIGEVKFLRAYKYFQMTQVFGPLPLLTSITYDKTTLGTVPEAQVIDFVLKELTDAAVDLPASYGGGTGVETGRITKGAALALKARVQLYYGRWADAATTAKQVMDLNTYSLFKLSTLTAADLSDTYSRYITFANTNDSVNFYKGLRSYEQLFWAANEGNSECILTSQYIENSSYDKSSGIYTLMMPNQVSGWSSITPTISLVDAYWNRDGSVFTPPTLAQRATQYNNGAPTANYIDEFKNRDTRLYASILFPTSSWNQLGAGFIFNWPKGGNNTSKTGYNFRKLVDPNHKAAWAAPQDYPLIRYAEVLLTYAEAKNEATGPDATIYDALDEIRSRVAMPLIPRTQTQASLREIIRRERRLELAAEGHRYADIRRWNIAAQVMKPEYDITNSLVQTRVWESKFVRFPYPQAAVDNNPLLKDAQAAKGY